MSQAILQTLLEAGRVWQGDASTGTSAGISSGFPSLDALLQEQGWPIGHLNELLVEGTGFGEVSLLLPLLVRQSQVGRVGLVAPPWALYAPALAHAGVALSNLLVVEGGRGSQALGAMEQMVRSGSFSLILGWHAEHVPMHALRRLQLAQSSRDNSVLILVRPSNQASQSSPAPLRVLAQPKPGGQLLIQILKRRGLPVHRPLVLFLPRPGRSCHVVSSPAISSAPSGGTVLPAIA